MRVLVALLLVLSAACQAAPPEPRPARAQAARLVMASGDGNALHLRAIDPNTLEDAPVAALDLPRCTRALEVQPQGALLAAITLEPACDETGQPVLRILDLESWQWRSEVPLALDEPSQPRAASMLAWSADGAWLYALVPTQSEQRRLWRIDVSGANAPISVPIEGSPRRLDSARNGTGVFVLSVLTRDNQVVAGSTLLNIYDASTLAVRTHVPLPNVRIFGRQPPAVALAPDGSRYYVAHADEPVLDVVDLRAPKLERFERSVALRSTPSLSASRGAWLSISADGRQLRTWRSAADPVDQVGLQTIDTRTWQVTTVDAVAMRLWTTLDGQWQVRLDPPPTRAVREGRRSTLYRLSVADPSGREASALLQDQALYGIGQYGADRLLVEFGEPWTIVAYDVGTWREVARRDVPRGAWLVTQSALR